MVRGAKQERKTLPVEVALARSSPMVMGIKKSKKKGSLKRIIMENRNSKRG
jgi:hypothetical protein